MNIGEQVYSIEERARVTTVAVSVKETERLRNKVLFMVYWRTTLSCVCNVVSKAVSTSTGSLHSYHIFHCLHIAKEIFSINLQIYAIIEIMYTSIYFEGTSMHLCHQHTRNTQEQLDDCYRQSY